MRTAERGDYRATGKLHFPAFKYGGFPHSKGVSLTVRIDTNERAEECMSNQDAISYIADTLATASYGFIVPKNELAPSSILLIHGLGTPATDVYQSISRDEQGAFTVNEERGIIVLLVYLEMGQTTAECLHRTRQMIRRHSEAVVELFKGAADGEQHSYVYTWEQV